MFFLCGSFGLILIGIINWLVSEHRIGFFRFSRSSFSSSLLYLLQQKSNEKEEKKKKRMKQKQTKKNTFFEKNLFTKEMKLKSLRSSHSFFLVFFACWFMMWHDEEREREDEWEEECGLYCIYLSSHPHFQSNGIVSNVIVGEMSRFLNTKKMYLFVSLNWFQSRVHFINTDDQIFCISIFCLNDFLLTTFPLLLTTFFFHSLLVWFHDWIEYFFQDFF